MTAPQKARYPDRDRNTEGRAENARPRDRYGRPLDRDRVDELADKREPDEVVTTVDEAVLEAVRLFDEHRFFEAHEFLEWVWKSGKVPEADRDFWKGVTQVAVGFTHTQRGNTDGAVTLLERAARYLAPYPSPHQGIDADALSAAALAVVAAVRDVGASPDHDFPTFPLAGRQPPVTPA
jgi:predicted metal-dependent hydrolase